MRYVLDTNTALYFLGGRLTDPLPEGSYAVSVITELELLAYPNITPAEESEIRSFLRDIRIVDLTEPVKTNAVGLRRRFRLRLPDAIIAATATYLDATLLTNDQQLRNVTEVRPQSLDII